MQEHRISFHHYTTEILTVTKPNKKAITISSVTYKTTWDLLSNSYKIVLCLERYFLFTCMMLKKWPLQPHSKWLSILLVNRLSWYSDHLKMVLGLYVRESYKMLCSRQSSKICPTTMINWSMSCSQKMLNKVNSVKLASVEIIMRRFIDFKQPC